MLKEPGEGPEGVTHLVDDETIATRARALASPVRWRILRACMPEALTNKELADLLGVNPGSMLHHVRTLVAAGFLAPGEVRRGSRNAVEIPYRTTRLVWRAGRSAAGFGDYLMGSISSDEPELGDADVFFTTVHADGERRDELKRRLRALLAEYEGGDERSWSVVISVRPTSDD